MTMTKRHFVLIAETIREFGGSSNAGAFDRERIARAFADRLAKTNGRFDRERFLRACEA